MTIDLDAAKFRRALRRAILWPVCAILGSALLLLLLIFELFHVFRWSEHSYQVILQIQLCEKLSTDMETGVRGYQLNSDKTFLEPYNNALLQIGPAFDRLKMLVKNDPDQTLRVDDLLQTENLWIDHAKESLRLHDANKGPGIEWNRASNGIMDSIRGKFESFAAIEQTLYAQRLHSVHVMKHVLGYGGGFLFITLSLLVAQLVRRQFHQLGAEYRTALEEASQRHAALVRSESDLEEQKEWFRVTLTSIGDGVIVTDREGRVVFMNQEAERMTGWTAVEALLKPLPSVFKIVNEETRLKVEDPVAKVFREKRVVGLANHTVLLSRMGQEWPIEDSAAPIYDRKGELLGVVLVFHNAMEIRHAQHMLKAHSDDLEKKVAQRTLTLQQAVSELEAFSYTVSHDLRSPLRTMQGFAQAVLEDYGEKLDEQGKNYLERIRNAAERLDRLTQDLLSYTRISRSDVPLVPLDLDRIVRDIIEHYPNLHAPTTEMEVANKLPRVLGLEAALTQVLSNVLGNATKFVPAGTLPRIKIWSEERDSRVRLWIQDNGIGIATRDAERIFQMFVQVNESQLYGGTGVGLAIVKKAVQTMHGSVGVESEEGAGSKFWIELEKASETHE